MYDYDFYPSIGGKASIFTGSGVWTIIALILAIIGGILVYFVFLKPEKPVEGKFLNWLREFLNFNEMVIETILKVTYLILAIFITLASFNLISTSFVSFLLTLTLGNVLLRVIYEASLILIMIWKNTTDINKKMK